MSYDDHAISARQNGVGKAELLDGGGNLSDLLLRVGARIAGIGQRFGHWPPLDFSD